MRISARHVREVKSNERRMGGFEGNNLVDLYRKETVLSTPKHSGRFRKKLNLNDIDRSPVSGVL